jgi:NADH:ubiquinone oxidoreductase subunit 6 (subunit J)
MTLQDAVFILLAGIVLVGAAMAVGFRHVFYNALGMGLSFTGLAGLYVYLNSDFLAAVQIIIYVGAIAIAIIFAIMVSQPMSLPTPHPAGGRIFKAAAVAGAIFVLLIQLLTKAPWPMPSAAPADFSIENIGRLFLTTYLLPFEVVSLVLLLAIVGALVIAHDRGKS